MCHRREAVNPPASIGVANQVKRSKQKGRSKHGVLWRPSLVKCSIERRAKISNHFLPVNKRDPSLRILPAVALSRSDLLEELSLEYPSSSCWFPSWESAYLLGYKSYPSVCPDIDSALVLVLLLPKKKELPSPNQPYSDILWTDFRAVASCPTSLPSGESK